MLVETLLVSLRRFRGTSLKAWRCDFDKQGVGWVSQAEFARACRFFGCSAEQIWQSCRVSGGAGMKFWELDHEEASNLELFEQVLWIRTGFDLSRAWAILDPNNRQALTIPEFVRGCRELGFDGDAVHIFKGLDHQGLGRLSRRDFEYLQQVSSCSAQGMSIELRMLRSWAAEVCADSIDLLLRLKMIGDHAGGWAQVLEPIEASEFARRLEVLGFPGEPTEIAAEVARCRGNGAASQISVEHVCCALFGLKQFRRAPGTAKDAVKTKTTLTTPVRKKNPIRKAEWDSSIYSGFCANASRPASLRVYFSSPPKDPVMHRAASNPALSRPATAVATGPVGPSANKGSSAQDRRGRSASPLRERLPRRVRPGELNHRP